MPNWVTNKITFDAAKAAEVFEAVKGARGDFDFERLVPIPPNMYRGSLSLEDEKDFPINWLNWGRDNWGTKWNCSQAKTGVDRDKAFIQFETAWSVPYPIIAAFLNRFQMPFELRYYDECPNFWGIEVYGKDRWDSGLQRTSKRLSDEADRKALELELFGRSPRYEPDDEDEEPSSGGGQHG